MTEVLLLGLPVLVLALLRRNPTTGVSVIVFLLVFLPLGIRVSVGDVFVLSIHRALMLAFLGWSVFRRNESKGVMPAGLSRFLAAIVVANGVSTFLAVYPMAALKNNMAFLLEEVALCYFLSKHLNGSSNAQRVLIVVSCAVCAVGLVGWLNRYLGYNPVEHLMPGVTGMRRSEMAAIGEVYYGRRDVFATFPHRILFGYGMAMILPFALSQALNGSGIRRACWIGVTIVVAGGCYFSNSRGPWIGAAVGLSTLWLWGSRNARRLVGVLCVGAFLLVMMRPGVRETLFGLMQSTWQRDAAKHQSYEYRWELWRVGWMAISASPGRCMFGFGGSATDSLDFSELSDLISVGALKSKTNDAIVFTSWDNNYARDMVAFGLVGLLLRVAFFGYVISSIAKYALAQPRERRDVPVALVAAVLVYCFSMTNVSIFAPQVRFLLWTLIAVFIVLDREKRHVLPAGTVVQH